MAQQSVEFGLQAVLRRHEIAYLTHQVLVNAQLWPMLLDLVHVVVDLERKFLERVHT